MNLALWMMRESTRLILSLAERKINEKRGKEHREVPVFIENIETD